MVQLARFGCGPLDCFSQLGEDRVEKSIDLPLNNFPTTPHSLRAEPSIDAPKPEIRIDLASLYHHYYFDKHGKAPPNPDPAQFEQLQYLRPEDHFRVTGDGLGNRKRVAQK